MSPMIIRRARFLLLPLALALPLLAGCGGEGEPVTTRSLARARRAWDQAKPRDYDLEWSSSGARRGSYRVFVREGQVRAIYMSNFDRKEGRERETVARPGEPRYFGVEGLFETIAEELAMAQSDGPFGQPRGTRVVLRFSADPRFGYPRHYRRDVLGTAQRLAIDVRRFDPSPTANIPPPRA